MCPAMASVMAGSVGLNKPFNAKECIMYQELKPKAQGHQERTEGESWYNWVLYDKKEVEGMDDDEIISMSGMIHYYGGPGQVFSEAGYVKRVGKRVLVKQYCGLDI